MDWVSLAILIVTVWLAVYVLTVLMAQHRRQLLSEWERKRALRQRRKALLPPTAAEPPPTAASPPPSEVPRVNASQAATPPG